MLQRFWNVSLWQRLNSSRKCKCCQFNKGCHFLGESNVTKQDKKKGEIRRQNKKLKKNNYELRIIKEEEERERKNETCKKQRERK